jgi:hypothetical protein
MLTFIRVKEISKSGQNPRRLQKSKIFFLLCLKSRPPCAVEIMFRERAAAPAA